MSVSPNFLIKNTQIDSLTNDMRSVIISGFIIMHILQKEFTVEFIIKVYFRIYPLLIFVVILEFMMDYLAKGHLLPPIWIPRLLLLGDFSDAPYALGGVE
jgi:hypothetical protein